MNTAAAHPPTQPTLGLPTTNKLCEDIRAANRHARHLHPKLPPATLAEARMEVLLATQELRNAYTLLKDHFPLASQATTAGKSAAHLLEMIDARIVGTMP